MSRLEWNSALLALHEFSLIENKNNNVAPDMTVHTVEDKFKYLTSPRSASEQQYFR